MKCQGCNDINRRKPKYLPLRVVKAGGGEKTVCSYCYEDYKNNPVVKILG